MLTLDSIIRNVLLNNRKPIHWYLEYLNHGKDCLRELNFDMLKSVNTQLITLTSYKAAPFPCDYVDFCRLGVPTGQRIRPLLQTSTISNLNNFDTLGNKILYPAAKTDPCNDFGATPIVNGVNFCYQYGGAWHGYRHERNGDVFKEIRARKEFQLDQLYPYDNIYLEYITDGSSCDAATQIHPYAQKTIEEYINWRVKYTNRNSGTGEVREAERMFTKERDTLAARLSDITIEDLKRVYRRSYYGAVKN